MGYDGSVGLEPFDQLAVMDDTFRPFGLGATAPAVDDTGHPWTWGSRGPA